MFSSFKQWLYMNKHKIPNYGLLMCGNMDYFTIDLLGEYVAWCKTPEGKMYCMLNNDFQNFSKNKKAV